MLLRISPKGGSWINPVKKADQSNVELPRASDARNEMVSSLDERRRVAGRQADRTMNLARFVYISRAVGEFGPLEVMQLRSSAERHNKLCGVTGLLLFNGQAFVQLVEGPGTNLKSVIDRITHDAQHNRIQIIEQGPTDCRQFSSWALKVCWRSLFAKTAPFATEVKEAVAGCTDARVQALFIGFAFRRT